MKGAVEKVFISLKTLQMGSLQHVVQLPVLLSPACKNLHWRTNLPMRALRKEVRKFDIEG